jgi:hypothetical protein
LDSTFQTSPKDKNVIYHLPITKDWIRQFVLARKVETNAVSLACDVRILVDWMHKDILSLCGPNLSDRQQLYDFVVEELTKRKLLCPHRISPVELLTGKRHSHWLELLGFERFSRN